MKTITTLLFTSLSILAYSQGQNYKALFIGNSYTQYNNLPNLVSNIASSLGDTLTTDANLSGGGTLSGHSVNQTSIDKIYSQQWDFVILQEQSQRPSFPDWQVQQEVYPYAATLDSMIEDNNICTETVFYMTWGRKHGDQQNCAGFPPICTYAGMQERLRNAYLQMGADNEATVSPVGMAFNNHILRDTLNAIDLYTSDNSHPSYAGSYLAACTHYATLFRNSPVGSDYYGSLDSATATYLQGIAAETVLDSLAQWRIGANDVVAHFELDPFVVADSVLLVNESQNSDSIFWILPNNSTSHNDTVLFYGEPFNTYEFTLIAVSECGVDTSTKSAYLAIESINELDIHFKLYPNPNNGNFKLEFGEPLSKPLKAEILDLAGRQLFSRIITEDHYFELQNFSKGTYLLQLSNNDGISVRKIIIKN